MNNGIFAKYTGIPIIVVPDSKKQNRIHKKKRINKKWAKRYGFIENNYPYIYEDKAIVFKGKIYMNEKTFLKLKNNIDLSSSFARDIASGATIIEY